MSYKVTLSIFLCNPFIAAECTRALLRLPHKPASSTQLSLQTLHVHVHKCLTCACACACAMCVHVLPLLAKQYVCMCMYMCKH